MSRRKARDHLPASRGVNGPVNENGIKAAVTRPRTRLSRATSRGRGLGGGGLREKLRVLAPSWIMASSFRPQFQACYSEQDILAFYPRNSV